ncbi:MAG: FAD/NAD(P)-binding protein [Peptococcaceae bacterium]|nr:FAD/NAD(P)-binding protein [Candidatus Syntrophopropionicum ammoniitolerans]
MPNPTALTPYPVTITKIVDETSDVKTFTVEFDDPEVMDNFGNKPGQVCMLSVFGEGESTISITSSPTRGKFLEFTVKRVGRLTEVLHQMEVGQKFGVRGPYGNWFPYEAMKGKDLFFVGGGFALAPIRSLIDFALSDQYRSDYGKVEVLYGARSVDDMCFKGDLAERWPKLHNTGIYTTIDRPQDDWKGHVGFVPNYVEEVAPSPKNKVAIIAGPPIMIKFTLPVFAKLGFKDEQIITTLEMRMKCCLGKCGRCNIGSKFVCVDGPVFSQAELKGMPKEY